MEIQITWCIFLTTSGWSHDIPLWFSLFHFQIEQKQKHTKKRSMSVKDILVVIENVLLDLDATLHQTYNRRFPADVNSRGKTLEYHTVPKT